MKSTQLKVARAWAYGLKNEFIQNPTSKKMFLAPSWYRIYHLTTTKQTNSKGSWFGWVLDKKEFITDDNTFEMASDFNESIRKGLIKPKYEEESDQVSRGHTILNGFKGLQNLKRFFFGLDRAYGQFIKEDQREDGKETGKAFITKKPVVDQLWLDHLDGKYPSFGVIPITDDSTCRWGCIDVDTYPLDHKALVVKLNKKKLPFIVARSKSGGAHIFVFLKEYAPAKLVLEKMSEIASSIGHGDCEIFS